MGMSVYTFDEYGIMAWHMFYRLFIRPKYKYSEMEQL